MRSIDWCHFQRLSTILNPYFKVTPIVGAEYLRNGTRKKHSYHGTLMGTNAHTPLSDLE